MDVVKAVKNYVDKMVTSVSGMKVLLLDKETTGIISMAYTHSEILQKEVYLFERLDMAREEMTHLKAVCCLRPVQENIDLLEKELRAPKYAEYHLFFTNIVSKSALKVLAQADEHEVVSQVQEYFCDYFPVNTDTFSLNLHSTICTDPSSERLLIARICDGLAACLLSLKKKPIIRCQKSTESVDGSKKGLCQHVAQELARRMEDERSLFEFRKQDVPPVLLILDRRNDPVTPLLSQWTYQAMVHELIGINNNRANLAKVSVNKELDKELQEIVLSPEHDEFYRENMYLNWGELGINIKQLMSKVQVADSNQRNIQTIDDMKHFLQNYPQFKKLKGNVSKHVALLGELLRLVNSRRLMDLSAVEQELACKHDIATAYRQVQELIRGEASGPGSSSMTTAVAEIKSFDLVRLVMLYSLRYESESNNQLPSLIDMLAQAGVEKDSIALIPALLKYAGSKIHAPDLFARDSSWMDYAKKLTGLQGVENIYTQHKPLLVDLLDQLLKGRLKESDYPCISGGIYSRSPGALAGTGSTITGAPPSVATSKQSVLNVIVFFVGGATYEEARFVNELNATNPTIRVVLGGTTIHRSESFLEEVAKIREFSTRYF